MATAFISYRRETAGSFALLLRDKMKELGFNVYLDHKEMHAGRFDDQIISNIKEATDFILIISANSLLRNDESRDFHLEEIELALKEEKNIIPVFLKNCNSQNMKDKISDNLANIFHLEGVKEGEPQLFEVQFIPRLIDLMSDSSDKQMYLASQNKTILSSRKKLETESLSERWKNAKAISICAYYADQIINSDIVINKLKDGVQFRYLIVDPTSDSAKEAATYKFCSGVKYRMNKFNLAYMSALDTLSILKENQLEGSLEIRKTSLFIPAAIMIVEKEDVTQNTVKVDFYTFDTEDEDRRSVIIRHIDKDNYDFFVKQFNYIWNSDQTIKINAE